MLTHRLDFGICLPFTPQSVVEYCNMEKEPNQLYHDLDKLIQENLDLTIKLHAANKEVGKLKLEVNRLVTEYSILQVAQSRHS